MMNGSGEDQIFKFKLFDVVEPTQHEKQMNCEVSWVSVKCQTINSAPDSYLRASNVVSIKIMETYSS